MYIHTYMYIYTYIHIYVYICIYLLYRFGPLFSQVRESCFNFHLRGGACRVDFFSRRRDEFSIVHICSCISLSVFSTYFYLSIYLLNIFSESETPRVDLCQPRQGARVNPQFSCVWFVTCVNEK